jgi:hypothetical protein
MIATYKFDTENGSNTKHMILAPDNPAALPCRLSRTSIDRPLLEGVNRSTANGIETTFAFVIGGQSPCAPRLWLFF